MNVTILLGSPRKNGNTEALVRPFCEELTKLGENNSDRPVEIYTIRLHEKKIAPCTACRVCQKDWTGFGCRIQDDMQEIARRVEESDLLILATPIYSWYCTPPMKAAMDRLVYGLNKYYGEKKGPSLWAGKKLALITTCGYPPEKGTDLWESGVKRYCKHSGLVYLGNLTERHMGYDTVFMDEEKAMHAREFARRILD